jgi:hypothetical protein
MATETTPVFTADQATTVNRLGVALTFLGPLLVVAGLVRLALGVIEIWKSTWGGLLTLPEGALLAFAGLAFVAAASDAKFLHDIKGREKEHLTHTFESIAVGFKSLLILACYVAFIAFINLWI